jgi:hypothetical protein
MKREPARWLTEIRNLDRELSELRLRFGRPKPSPDYEAGNDAPLEQIFAAFRRYELDYREQVDGYFRTWIAQRGDPYRLEAESYWIAQRLDYALWLLDGLSVADAKGVCICLPVIRGRLHATLPEWLLIQTWHAVNAERFFERIEAGASKVPPFIKGDIDNGFAA